MKKLVAILMITAFLISCGDNATTTTESVSDSTQMENIIPADTSNATNNDSIN